MPGRDAYLDGLLGGDEEVRIKLKVLG